MRFDPDRVLAHLQALDDPSGAGSESERRASDDLARRFQQANLSVAQFEVPHRSARVLRPILRFFQAWRPSAAGPSPPARHLIARAVGTAPAPARVVLLARLRTPDARGKADCGTGLALLAEIARTWPARIAERVETYFVATTDPSRLTPRLLTHADEEKPTLVITLDTPGVGPSLVIAGRGRATLLARQSAHDLWIPFRSAWRLPRALAPRACRRAGWTCLGLRGMSSHGPVDPALLAATAQLVTEMTLRWAKQATTSTQGESLARSSQNPG